MADKAAVEAAVQQLSIAVANLETVVNEMPTLDLTDVHAGVVNMTNAINAIATRIPKPAPAA